MTFWLVVLAILVLMTGHGYWACVVLYFAFATISGDEPDPPKPPPETPPEDIDNSG